MEIAKDWCRSSEKRVVSVMWEITLDRRYCLGNYSSFKELIIFLVVAVEV
jgi:hypothetical protein